MSEESSSQEGSRLIWTPRARLVAATGLAVAVIGGVGMWIFADRAGTLAEQVFADIESVEIVESVDIGDEVEETPPVAPATPESAPPESERLDADPLQEYRGVYDNIFSRDRANLLHMTVDRPAYRPGQPVRWKVWGVDAGSFGEPSFSTRGSRDTHRIKLLDAGGSIAAEAGESVESGSATGEFQIADDAPGGVWTVQIIDEEEDALVYERPVLVTDFEPPRFLQDVDFERDGYRQGEEVRAEIEVRRETGEPVAETTIDGQLQVAGSHVTDLDVALDVGGRAEVEFELPSVIEADDAALILSIEEGGAVEGEVWPIPLALEDVEVTFHPEGGDLVEGLNSRVYFEATDRSGEPIKLVGSVVDDKGHKVAKVESEHRGQGRFELTPEVGREYRLEVSHPEVKRDYSLPEAGAEGCVMRVYDDFDSQKDSLRVALWCAEEMKVGILAAMADELVDGAAMMAGPDEPAVAYLSPEDGQWPRPAGVVRATAVDWEAAFEYDELEDLYRLRHDGELIRILADRVAFRGRRAQMDIDIELDRDVYHPGQTLEMEITTRDPAGVEVDADVVLTAVDDRVYARAEHLDVPSILGQLLLESDDLHFWADADEVDDYFDLYEDTAGALDLLMGSRGWRSKEMREEYYLDGGERRMTLISRQRTARVARESARAHASPSEPPARDEAPQEKTPQEEAGIPFAFGVDGGGGGDSGGTITRDSVDSPTIDLSGDDPLGDGVVVEHLEGEEDAPPPVFEEGVGDGGDHLVVELEDERWKRSEPKEESIPPEPPEPPTPEPSEPSEPPTPEPLGSDSEPEPESESRWQRLFGESKHDEKRSVSIGDGYDGDEGESFGDRSERADDERAARGVEPVEVEPPRMWRDAETVQFSAWGPNLSTGDDGRVAPVFELTEAVGAYRVVVEGISDDGLVGRGEAVITVEAPLSVATRFPSTLSGGDAVALPATVRNTHDEELPVQVDVDVQGAAEIGEGFDTFEIDVPARSTLTRYVPMSVEDRRGDVVVDVWAQGGGFIDGRRRTASVEPRGVERTLFASGSLPGEESVDLALDQLTDSGAEARVAIHTGAASRALEGVAEMDRRPLGCFEQISARHHINLLIWEYLSRTGELDEKMKERLHHRIVDGYQRMAEYEVEGGGFEWFDGDEAQAHLTAWALIQFAKMEEVFGVVDPALVERSVGFLSSLARADGGYGKGSEDAWRDMGERRRRASELFVTYGLARSGWASEFEPQIEVARTTAVEGDEVYEVALAAAALVAAGEESEVLDAAMSNLASLQRDDGAFVSENGQSWAGGYGGALGVETTGLAAVTLLEGDGDDVAAKEALSWLERQSTASGWWGSTQATAMALEAMLSAEGDGAEFRGDVEIIIDGQPVAKKTVSSAQLESRFVTGLGAYLDRQSRQIEIRSDVAVDYDLEVRWRKVGSKEEVEEAPLIFDVHVPEATDVTMGDEVSMEVSLENRRDHELGMVVARLSIPGGLGVSDRELDALMERSAVDYYETTGREIRLYFDDFGAAESKSLRLSATVDVPGAYEIPPSVAYPYYGDDSQWVWSDAGEMAVHLPRP